MHLSAAGFYKTPDIHWDRAAGKGRPFYYFAYGAAVSEVSVDTLTGEYHVDRTDILHDVGRSLNPAVDRGQVEGGFIQGMGWLTTEELWWDDKGRLRTHAPSTYKIPLASDRPAIFNVKLADWSVNREPTIRRSKAVGEPPFMLAVSVLEALSMAVASVADYRECPRLDAPATPERVLMAVSRLGGRRWRCGPRRSRRSSTQGPAMLVRVESARGSTPREAGAWMLVSRGGTLGTIGGGQLEYMAIDAARALLARGGDAAVARRAAGAGDRPVLRRADAAARGAGRGPRRGSGCWRGRPRERRRCRRCMCSAPATSGGRWRRRWRSCRCGRCSSTSGPRSCAMAPAGVETVLTPLPEEVVRRRAPGGAFVVLTHDHALDFLIVREALARGDAAYVGMIGSRTKRVSFQRWLARGGARSTPTRSSARSGRPGGRTSGRK